MKIFTVFDTAAGAYLNPFFMKTKGEAIRGFTELVNDEKSQFGKYPDDYVLFLLGEFDEFTGKIVTLPAPQSLGVAIEFKRPIQ